jgi:hypothetical protein
MRPDDRRRQDGAVAHESSGRREVAPFVHRRHRMACRQHDKLLAPALEEWGGTDQERLGALSDEGREGELDRSFCFDPEGAVLIKKWR